jgi:hypothetical protein
MGTMATTVVESIVIEAEPGAVYDLVADVARMGEWSPEATGARGAEPVLKQGDRFIGWNRRGFVRWFTQCTVLAASRGAEFAFDVDFGPVPVSRWTYEFAALDGGTRVTETWVDRRRGIFGPAVRLAGQLVIPGPRAAHNRATMVQTLRRLKVEAESAR